MRPPKGELKFPLEASHWQFQVGALHGLLQTEAFWEKAIKVCLDRILKVDALGISEEVLDEALPETSSED